MNNAKSLDPGLRRDDDFGASIFSIIVPAQAGTQRLSLKAGHDDLFTA